MGSWESALSEEISGLVTLSLTHCRVWSSILTLPAGQQVVELNAQVHFQAMTLQKAANPSLPLSHLSSSPELC